MKFFEKQSDSWLIAFYGFLTGLEALWRARKSYYQQEGALRGKPFIRLEDGSHSKPFLWDNTTPKVFLPPKGETQFPIVKRSLVRDEKALHFLETLGMAYPDMADEVLELVLPLYKSEQPSVTPAAYNTHLEQISTALASPSEEKCKRLQEGLKNSYFVKAVNAADIDQHQWKRPIREEVFYATPSTISWFDGNAEAWFVDQATLQNPTWGDIAPYISLSHVPVVKLDVYNYTTHSGHRRGLNAFNPSAKIIGLEHSITHINTARAVLLWDLLLANSHLVKGFVETATRRDFSNAKKEYLWSGLGKICRDSKWMPDSVGTFHKPQELFLTDLPKEFEKDTATAKILAAMLGMKKPELQQLAEKVGISVQDIELMQQNPESLKLFKQFLEEQASKKTEESQLPKQDASDTGSKQDNSASNNSSSPNAASPARNKSGGTESPRSRLLSYVLPKSETDISEQNEDIEEDEKQDTSDRKEAVNRAGVDIVLAWEAQAGRYPTEMSHTHPGYDVESKNGDGDVVRYIEVKSRTGVWDQQGVTLSDTQFREAQKRGVLYWLYIVENADQEDAQLFRIQDPANHVEYFCFDSGGSGLSE